MPMLSPPEVFDELMRLLRVDSGGSLDYTPTQRDAAEAAITRMLVAGWNPQAVSPEVPAESVEEYAYKSDMEVLAMGEYNDQQALVKRWGSNGATELDKIMNNIFEGETE